MYIVQKEKDYDLKIKNRSRDVNGFQKQIKSGIKYGLKVIILINID